MDLSLLLPPQKKIPSPFFRPLVFPTKSPGKIPQLVSSSHLGPWCAVRKQKTALLCSSPSKEPHPIPPLHHLPSMPLFKPFSPFLF